MAEKTEIPKKDGLSKTEELQKNDDSFAKAGADIVSNVVLAADSAGVADTLFSDDLVEAAKNYKKRAPINLTIESEEPKELVHTLSDLKDRALNLQRKDEQGILNESNGAGVVVRKDGQVNLAASKYSQYKLSPNGRATEQAMESVTITNRHKLFTEEIVVNEHKLNPQLWELADFRTSRLPTNDHAFVGGLCMFGSILVKAWEPNLKRYMLIRRPWLGPMFGPFLNVAEVNPALGISDPLKLEEDILALSDKGYQVNGIIKDAKSLIGKQGEDRSGIIRNQDAMASSGGTSSGGGSSGSKKGSIGKFTGKPGNTVKNESETSEMPGKYKTARIISGQLGIPTEFILAQMVQESGWSDDESGGQYHNYGGLKVGDIGYGEWNGHTTFPDDETYAAYWSECVLAIQNRLSDLTKCAKDGDTYGYVHIMKEEGYFEGDESEYASNFDSIVRTLSS